MSGLSYTKLALQDCKNILDGISRDRPVAAIELVDRIQETCIQLSHSPTMGTARNDLSPDLRAFTVKPYVIYFRPTERGVTVVRILHGARNVTRIIRSRKR